MLSALPSFAQDKPVEDLIRYVNPMIGTQRMGHTYPGLIADRFSLLLQFQCYAAAGDPEIRRHVSRSFRALAEDVTRLSGASPRQVAEFLASGMLANVTTVLELPELCDPLWADDPEKHLGAAAGRPASAEVAG